MAAAPTWKCKTVSVFHNSPPSFLRSPFCLEFYGRLQPCGTQESPQGRLHAIFHEIRLQQPRYALLGWDANPLSTMDLVANFVQFVDFSTNLIHGAREDISLHQGYVKER
jgi:hypothetical protein